MDHAMIFFKYTLSAVLSAFMYEAEVELSDEVKRTEWQGDPLKRNVKISIA